ncbi:MAG: hypothetical protein ACRD2G_15375 [Terriglobia bacterium]
MAGKLQRDTYRTAAEALSTLGRDYNYWSQKLTDSSWQMCLAVIAGNWAYYGSVAAVMESAWALASLAVIFISLAVALLFSFIMSEIHRSAFYVAESDWSAWEQRFDHYRNAVKSRDPFPATRTIDRIGIFTRVIKTFLPLIAGLILVIGAICSR